jgi:hypothetical protein
VAFGTSVSRKLLMTMVLVVVAVHAVAIGLYYALGISGRSNNIQTAFVGVWVLCTLGIVVVYMKRIRQLRDAAIGRRRPAQSS